MGNIRTRNEHGGRRVATRRRLFEARRAAQRGTERRTTRHGTAGNAARQGGAA